MVKKILSIAIKSALIIVCIIGVLLTASMDHGFMGTSFTFLYFTVQSNITIAAITAVFLVDEIIGHKFVNQVFYLIKFAFTIAITITFLVFFTMLAPLLGADYLFSFENFSLHAIVPILAMADFFIFDKDINLDFPRPLTGLGMPLYYLIFYIIGVPLGFEYDGAGNRAPYFFLNFDQVGWLFEKGQIGVIPWCLILLVAMTGLCMLFALLMKLRQGKLKRKAK